MPVKEAILEMELDGLITIHKAGWSSCLFSDCWSWEGDRATGMGGCMHLRYEDWWDHCEECPGACERMRRKDYIASEVW
jgi:hypothetical protein